MGAGTPPSALVCASGPFTLSTSVKIHDLSPTLLEGLALTRIVFLLLNGAHLDLQVNARGNDK